MNVWPKQCGCGASYYAGEWTSLPFVGYQSDGDDGRLELRNCSCKSTLAVEIERTGLPWTLAEDLANVARIDAERARGLVDPYTWPPNKGVPNVVSLDDLEEAKRLDAIADELVARSRTTLPAPPEAA